MKFESTPNTDSKHQKDLELESGSVDLTIDDDQIDLDAEHREAERIYRERKDLEVIKKHEEEIEAKRREDEEDDRDELIKMNQRF